MARLNLACDLLDLCRTTPHARVWDSLILDSNTDPLCARLRHRNEVVSCHVNGVAICVEQTKLDSAEDGGQGNEELRLGEVHAKAHARPLAERDEVFGQRAPGGASLGAVKPALGLERVRVGEDRRVPVLQVRRHAEWCVGRNDVVAVSDGRVGVAAREALRYTIGKPERYIPQPLARDMIFFCGVLATFLNHSVQVGELLEVCERWYLLRVWNSFREFLAQALADGAVLQDPEARHRQN